MPLPAAIQSKSATWPITVGAEGIAAAQFARCGFDVLVQAGRDKPWYDLAVTRAGNLLKVSVKASDDGRWDLTQSFSRTRRTSDPAGGVDCRHAIDLWVDSMGSKTICCLVQFEGVAIDRLPRMYLAFPYEIAVHMRLTAHRTGDCVLQEHYEWADADGVNQIEALPATWNFSQARIQELLNSLAAPAAAGPVAVKAYAAPGTAQAPKVASPELAYGM